jgi:hypothetical protein
MEIFVSLNVALVAVCAVSARLRTFGKVRHLQCEKQREEGIINLRGRAAHKLDTYVIVTTGWVFTNI